MAARPRTQDVPGTHPGAAAGVGDELFERPAHAGQQVPADLDAVDRDAHVEREEAVSVPIGLQLVGGDQPRAERGGGVLSLGRAEVHLHLAALQVAGRPVVEDGVPEDLHLLRRRRLGVPADHAGDLELEVEQLRSGRDRDVVVRADQRAGVGEVERRCFVPLRHHPAAVADGSDHALHVLLERDEVPHRRRFERRQQPDLVERHGGSGQRRRSGVQRRGQPAAHQVEHRAGQLVHPGRGHHAGVDLAGLLVGREAHQTGGATKRPLSTSLNDRDATNSFIALAVPHWSDTSGRVKS